MSQQLLYNIEQVQAQLGGLSRSRVYQEIASGRLQTTKIGARTFVTAEALAEYVRQLPDATPAA